MTDSTSTDETGAPTDPADASVRIDGVTKTFETAEGGTVTAVDDVSLSVREGEFLVLVGPSGCGKTTTLRSVAGLEAPTSGRILIGGRDVTGLEPRERDVSMVFQNYALYPNRTVRGNIEFPLTVRNFPAEERERRVAETAELLGIEDLLARKPGQLSGGQQQRVALGRAIVREPAVFLMDEPLSNLDAKLRVQMRTELNELHKRVGKTTIYVTHDQAEAMTLGDRIAVMREGAIQQVGPPQTVYEEPANEFVAGFVGEPPMNFFDCEIDRREISIRASGEAASSESEARPQGAPRKGERERSDTRAKRHASSETGTYPVDTGAFSLPLPARHAARLDALAAVPERATLGIRPEDVDDAALLDDPDPARTFEAGVKLVEPMGSEKVVTLTLPAEGRTDRTFTAALDPASEVREDERLRVAVDVDRVHLFDPETGANLTVGGA